MNQVKAGAVEASKGGALVTGYGSIGLLVESITSYHWPWLMPGAVTMATVTVLHMLQSAWAGWMKEKHRRAGLEIGE